MLIVLFCFCFLLVPDAPTVVSFASFLCFANKKNQKSNNGAVHFPQTNNTPSLTPPPPPPPTPPSRPPARPACHPGRSTPNHHRPAASRWPQRSAAPAARARATRARRVLPRQPATMGGRGGRRGRACVVALPGPARQRAPGPGRRPGRCARRRGRGRAPLHHGLQARGLPRHHHRHHHPTHTHSPAQTVHWRRAGEGGCGRPGRGRGRARRRAPARPPYCPCPPPGSGPGRLGRSARLPAGRIGRRRDGSRWRCRPPAATPPGAPRARLQLPLVRRVSAHE